MIGSDVVCPPETDSDALHLCLQAHANSKRKSIVIEVRIDIDHVLTIIIIYHSQ